MSSVAPTQHYAFRIYASLLLTIGCGTGPAEPPAIPEAPRLVVATASDRYELVVTPDGILWEDARDAAVAFGGHLVTITSEAENDLLLELFDEQINSFVWIGASDTDVEGEWRWIAGPEAGQLLSYTHWGSVEPNDAGIAGEDVAVLNLGPLSPGGTATGKWGDTNDQAEFPGFIVEFEPPSITGQTVTRQQGAAASNSAIAAVSDPVEAAGDLLVSATAVPTGISVNSLSNAGGAVTGNIGAGCTAALGNNTVELAVTNSRNLTATSSLIVIVTPSNAPRMTLQPSVSLTPTNKHYQSVTMDEMLVGAIDDCDGNLFGGVVIETVSSDELDDAPGNSDGNTINDIVIAADCKSVQLRAERNTAMNGRVYSITLRVGDGSGNVTREVYRVTVPLSKKIPAVRDASSIAVISLCA